MNPFIRAIPASLVRGFARRYVAGDSVGQALDVARTLRQSGLCATLDLLAEGIDTQELARANVDTYLEVVDAVAAARDPAADAAACTTSVSLKLSSYTSSPLHRGGGGDGCRAALAEICQRAMAQQVSLTVDMEDHRWTEFTLKLFHEAHQSWSAGGLDIGIVLQTRLHRCAGDIERLPIGCRVRLVIGIYNEPEAIALIDKRQMKERMLEFATLLLGRGHYVEFATHDQDLVRRFIDQAEANSAVGYEVQMLYGVPRQTLQRQLVDNGVTTRLYVPFATSWAMAIDYLRRRLDESPGMMLLAGRNLLGL